MEAPSWVCNYVEKINPKVRLAWWGRRGVFAILELLPARLVPYSVRPRWDVQDMGTIYGSSFDSLMLIPVIQDVVEPIKVFDGSVIDVMKEICAGIDAINEHNRRHAAELDRRDNELAGEMGAEMKHRAKKGYAYTLEKATVEDGMIAAGEIDVAVPGLPEQKAVF